MLLYVDLDGVLVDFNKGYYDLTGIDLNNNFIKGNKFWNPINEKGYTFWENLDWMVDGKILWEYIKNFNPIILSAPSLNKSSHIGKQKWVNNNIPGTDLILCPSNKKYIYANSNNVLIDDREDNIADWVFKGKGIGILHKNALDTIKELNKWQKAI